MTPDKSRMIRAADLVGEDKSETSELKALVDQAKRFLIGFDWCSEVEEVYSGIAVPGVIGVFLMQIVPAFQDVDDQLWAVVGDVPPAYLVTDEAPNAPRALELYLGLMQEWIDAVKAGRPVEDLIPVNAPPTEEAAQMLQSRLNFLTSRVLTEHRHKIKE